MPRFTIVIFAALLLMGACRPTLLRAQQPAAQQEAEPDLTRLFLAGRAVICVTQHDIVIGTIADQGAPSAQAPIILPIGSSFVGIMFGAVNWDAAGNAPASARFEAQLSRVADRAAARIAKPEPNAPGDIERMGIAVLELLRPLVEGIHTKLNLPAGQPFFQLVLLDYADDYGAEVWSVEYRVEQDQLRGEFWGSRIQRPGYHQLFPPEKGQPRTAVEVRYPKPKSLEASLLDRIVRHDPAFDSIRASSPDVADGASTFAGSMLKSAPEPVAKFLVAALPVAAGGKGRPTVALLNDLHGFQWALPPEQPPPPPDPQDPNKPRQEGAPTLRKYTPTQ